uniref:Tubulin delta chain n=2 Tax=Clytia hemisphaerica TaxID=252671 RepID=A0A7M5V5F2_9CNID
MSIVTIQLGQCGNQIGCDLFSLLYQDAHQTPKYSSFETLENTSYKMDTLERYFTEINTSSEKRYEAKAVLVDMEVKVVHACKQTAAKIGAWNYSSSSLVRKKGSGNNWALGFHGYGHSVADDIIDLCRKEAEKCDRFAGFFILMSLAGGTGSGLGAYVTQELRDAFPSSYLVNHVVWPYTSGEVIVQNYNIMLTMSRLQASSDLVIAQRNDHLHQICAKRLGFKKISLQHVNSVIAHKLASILQPATEEYRSVNTLSGIVTALGTHPAYKLASVKCIPHISDQAMSYSVFVWPALLKHMRQMLIADSPMEDGINWEIREPQQSSTASASDVFESHTQDGEIRRSSFNKSIANLMILRGKELHEADTNSFGNPRLYSEGSPIYTEWQQPRSFNQYQKSITLLSNSQTFVQPMTKSVTKAWEMFNSKAYLHQYEKYGLGVDDFIDSFGVVEQMIADYSRI